MNSYNILADTSDQEEHYELQELFVRWEPSSGPLALLHSNNTYEVLCIPPAFPKPPDTRFDIPGPRMPLVPFTLVFMAPTIWETWLVKANEKA
jgi:hypothetical protein